jgi:hypothetical protein
MEKASRTLSCRCRRRPRCDLRRTRRSPNSRGRAQLSRRAMRRLPECRRARGNFVDRPSTIWRRRIFRVGSLIGRLNAGGGDHRVVKRAVTCAQFRPGAQDPVIAWAALTGQARALGSSLCDALGQSRGGRAIPGRSNRRRKDNADANQINDNDQGDQEAHLCRSEPTTEQLNIRAPAFVPPVARRFGF